MRIVTCCIAVLGLWLSFAIAGYSQPNDSLIEYSIVGSINGSTPSNLNPFVVLGKVEVQRLLLELSETPRDPEFVDRRLVGTMLSARDLETLSLIKKVNERYVVGFSFFTRDDDVRVRAVAGKYALSLAKVYLSHRADIAAVLKQYDAADVDEHDLAFIMLGCFSLDWDGLALTAEKKYRSVAKDQPGGNRYSLWAKETNDLSLQRIYWGSTTDTISGTSLTSFGDHYSLPRNTFPDLSFRLYERFRAIDLPDPIRSKVVRAGAFSLDGMSAKVVAVMKTLRDRPATEPEIASTAHIDAAELHNLLSLLIELEYITQRGNVYSIRIPVLTKTDKAMVEDLRSTSRKLLEPWLAENYPRIKNELRDISPLTNGVPFEDLFTHIWHYLFGLANREMAELGLFADPYSKARRFQGFLPVIWDTSIAKLP